MHRSFSGEKATVSFLKHATKISFPGNNVRVSIGRNGVNSLRSGKWKWPRKETNLLVCATFTCATTPQAESWVDSGRQGRRGWNGIPGRLLDIQQFITSGLFSDIRSTAAFEGLQSQKHSVQTNRTASSGVLFSH
ncbi:uncharacterized protein LOC115068917 isoform X3 [Nannospalax galili]|uniref:uncharacterized protein LOC115068917 isoform X3 n=1 Tax=Nannospalax galili TaxID=1026970 RepID=UPI00111C8EBF|nr:uncharacterized protein LOC115068917 isoform X3 [Nannospalax galili]